MKTIGVDLGTTNSCVYYLDDEDRPVLVTDRLGRKIFPSVVWCAGPGEEVLVGHKAKSRLGTQPPPVAAIKRKIGTTETVALGGRDASPVEVSAHTLSFLAALVEEATGEKVGAAVVTVPAYFDAAPKKDTYQAAVEAFFSGDGDAAQGRLELQSEPEAAGFAYTLEDPAERLRILAYDLGGGTFDVTLLEKSPEAGLTTIKFGGDPHLGGENFDDRLTAWLLYLLRGGKPQALERLLDPQRYPDEERYTLLQQVLTHDIAALRGRLRPEDRELLVDASPRYALDLDSRRPEDLPRIQKLKALAEKAKMDLTVATETAVTQQGAFEDQAGEVVDVDLPLNRGTFNRLTTDLVERTLEETRRVLEASRLGAGDVDRVILVGGSSRMPIVREELEKLFTCPVQMADPDLIVARGAALRARELSQAAAGGETGLTLEYPRRTAEPRVRIKGRLAAAAAGGHAYLSRAGEDVADAPLDGDRFLLEVDLAPGAASTFHLEVVDAEEAIVAAAEVAIVHDPQALSAGSLSPKLTKPIRAQGMRGYKELLTEGEALPARTSHECFRGSQDDRIVIPLYEGERWLTNLVITGVDPDLPEGSVIDLAIALDKDYTCSATATVRSSGQAASVEFEIARLEIPPLEEMDQDLEAALDELDNDLDAVRDRDRRAGLARRGRRLEADYRKARRAVTPDLHHLYTLVGELRKLLVDVRGAHDLLEPPLEVFERLAGLARSLAGRLGPESPVPPADALAKLAALERAGRQAWEGQDAATWRSVCGQLEQLRRDLEGALRPAAPGPQEMPPALIQRELLAWLGGLAQKVEEHGLEDGLPAELAQVERAVHQVDTSAGAGARDALMQIVHEQLKPLDHRIAKALAKRGTRVADDGGTGVNVYF